MFPLDPYVRVFDLYVANRKFFVGPPLLITAKGWSTALRLPADKDERAAIVHDVASHLRMYQIGDRYIPSPEQWQWIEHMIERAAALD
jgi:hypothetical protein